MSTFSNAFAAYYSLIAGFMEPGESAEQAAARELWEEAGVRAVSVREVATQSWVRSSATARFTT